MEPKRFYSQNFSLFIVKFKKLWFSAPLMLSKDYLIIMLYTKLNKDTVTDGRAA